MRVPFILALFLAAGFAFGAAHRQEAWREKLLEVERQFSAPVASLESSASKVTVSTVLSVSRVHPGSQFQAALLLGIQDRWHINAHKPNQEFLIGTELDLGASPSVQVLDIHYPEGEEVKFDFAEELLKVYEGSVKILVVLKADSEIQPGWHTIQGSLRVQACDDQVCLAPSTVEFAIPFEVVGLQQPVTPANMDIFSSVSGTATDSSQEVSENAIAAIFRDRGSLGAFLGIFVIGLALNLTPCVYPMLSVTLSLFGAQNEIGTWRVLLKAALYVLGIATMYSALGVAAAFGGGLFGGMLQSPVVLISIGALLLLLSLSMFGLYELQAPYWLRSKLGGTTATGHAGIYFSGLVVGVFAAPCIGAPIIALLAFVGAQGDPVFGFWIFFVLSLGLGAPYLILGTFSNLLTKIPKSGVWMVWAKKIFGVLMAGAAVFYIGLALFPKHTVYVVPATLLAGGLYLGFLENFGKEHRTLRRLQRIFGAACILLFALSLNALRKPTLEWQPFSPGSLAQARERRVPVMMDFYADWCIPCLELDRLTFTDRGVIEATKDFVKLKVDLTHFDSRDAEALRRQFDVSGVPTIVFLGPDGEEWPNTRVVGFVSPTQLMSKLQPVLDVTEMRRRPQN